MIELLKERLRRVNRICAYLNAWAEHVQHEADIPPVGKAMTPMDEQTTVALHHLSDFELIKLTYSKFLDTLFVCELPAACEGAVGAAVGHGSSGRPAMLNQATAPALTDAPLLKLGPPGLRESRAPSRLRSHIPARDRRLVLRGDFWGCFALH
jgi:hypothetical protein